MFKRFVKWTMGGLLALLLLCAGLVFIVDPFQQYRAATWYVPIFDSQVQAYSNAGVAKHYDYDTMIIGTSMMENTRTSQVDERFGGRSIKLCFSGGMAMNHDQVLRLGFETREVARVIYGLDMYSFVRDKKYSSFEMPMYLYNSNPFDDVKYLLNGEVAINRVGSAFKYNLGPDAPEKLDRDRMYFWGDHKGTVYGEAQARATVDLSGEPAEMEPHDQYAENVEINFDLYVRPYLEAHPETEFIFVVPPYSVLEWARMLHVGHLDFVQYTKEWLAEELLAYDNVKLYDYSARAEWVEDLSLYKDYSHYKPEVNDAVIDAIARDEDRIHDIFDVYERDEWLYEVAEEIVHAQ